MYQYTIIPEDRQGRSTGTNDLQKAIITAANRAAKTYKIWQIWANGSLLMACNEYTEQAIKLLAKSE